MKKEIHFHGELVIREVSSIPSKAKKIDGDKDVRLADSETTGNHHMLKHVPGVTVFADVDDMGKFFVSSQDVEPKIFCLHEDRHDDLVLPAGKTWEITPAKEWDHVSQIKRTVLD